MKKRSEDFSKTGAASVLRDPVSIALAVVAFLLLLIAIYLAIGIMESLLDNDRSRTSSDYGDPAIVEKEGPSITPDSTDMVVLSSRKTDYYPGKFGPVVVEEPSCSAFSSKEAYDDYNGNWHDKSWKGELPSTGRYKTAHFKNDDEATWVAGEVIVVFPYETSDNDIQASAKDNDAEIGTISYSKQAHDFKMATFYFDDFIDPFVCAEKLEHEIPQAEAAFPNILNHVADSKTSIRPDDPDIARQSYLSLSRFDEAWNTATCDNEVTVAVFDTGIDMDHIDLKANIDYAQAYDAIERQSLPGDFTDRNGHGTVVSGIISAVANNGQGIAGCSYNATILPIRVLDETSAGTVFDLGEGLGHLFDLQDKPEVVNMSLGQSAEDWTTVINEIVYGTVCQGRISELSSKFDIVFVASAGNKGKEGSPYSYPAALHKVIAVASVDENKTHAASSTANETVDICAMGVETYSTTDPEAGLGQRWYYSDSYETRDENGLVKNEPISGTSFAAPQVSAAAALLKTLHPNWGFDEVSQALESTAEPLSDYDGINDKFEYGAGLLDAAAAVRYQPSGGGSWSPGTGGELFDGITPLSENPSFGAATGENGNVWTS